MGLHYSAPIAQTASRYGVAIGYYVNCDDAVCADDAPAGFDAGDYSQWEGFDGWEEPAVIFMDTESDTPTHCVKCGRVIRHDLTADGIRYVADAIVEQITDGSHTGEVIAQWWDAYQDAMDESDLRGIVERALEARQDAGAGA